MDITIQGSTTDKNGDKRHSFINLSTYGPYDLAIQLDDGPAVELTREQMCELAKAMKFLVKDF